MVTEFGPQGTCHFSIRIVKYGPGPTWVLPPNPGSSSSPILSRRPLGSAAEAQSTGLPRHVRGRYCAEDLPGGREYELQGVVVHSGSCHGGHYYSCVTPDRKDWSAARAGQSRSSADL